MNNERLINRKQRQEISSGLAANLYSPSIEVLDRSFMFTQIWWLFPLGLLVGAFGTLIGAGGGFILVPILLLMYPNETSERIASISLAVVFFNAFSGSLAYARMKRIDYKSG